MRSLTLKQQVGTIVLIICKKVWKISGDHLRFWHKKALDLSKAQFVLFRIW